METLETKVNEEEDCMLKFLGRFKTVRLARSMTQDFVYATEDETYSPRYLFYGTTSKGMERIKENGLKPTTKGVSFICLYSDYKSAKEDSICKSDRDSSENIVLYIDREETPGIKLDRYDSDRFKCNDAVDVRKLKKVGFVLDFLLTL